MTEKPLLDTLAQGCSCDYLSMLYGILPCSLYAHEIAVQLDLIDVSRYSLKEWKDAVRYISGGKCSTLTGDTAEICTRFKEYLEP